jgi:mRNA-degrading endonuclease RelE of RelBE toxin-antitoxin system
MKIKAYESFRQAYLKLPSAIQKKADRQLSVLAENVYHSSLHTKKIKGKEGIWEARVDFHYRMTFEIVEDTIMLRVIGNHDEVLKKP